MLGIGFCILAYISKVSASLPVSAISQCACKDNSSETSEENSAVVENTEPENKPVGDAKNEEK